MAKDETRTQRASLTLTPSEREALELVASKVPMTKSELLRLHSVREIVQLAQFLEGDDDAGHDD